MGLENSARHVFLKIIDLPVILTNDANCANLDELEYCL